MKKTSRSISNNPPSLKLRRTRIFVGVSGGVDSSVALALLKDQGYDVTGVFLKVWNPDWLACNWRDERRSAMRICAALGVPFRTLDCEKEYKEKIVDYMLAEYKAGRTPNPDVFCNKEIKFGVFLDKTRELGADFIATGHYARKENNKLLEARDKDKDQSYFLSQLSGDQLAHALFPVGDLEKSEVRALAKKYHLPTAEKKDSQGLCFIGKVDMKDFLRHYLKDEASAAPGDLLNDTGKVIGRHEGALYYTIGERHGFEIFDEFKTNHDERMFVVAKNVADNTVTVANYTNEIQFTNKNAQSYKLKTINWISDAPPDLSMPYGVRFRYRQEKQKCVLSRTVLDNAGGVFEITPETPQIVASGQVAVIYDGEVCLGGGVIA